jgi:glucose-6-phosphate 1-dehydrogenase
MAFDLVLFGGTGDLAWRKLLPALFQAHRHGMLPDGGRILAIGRTATPTTTYRKWLWERFQDVEDAKRPGTANSRASPRCCTTFASDLSQPADYDGARMGEPAR